MLNCSRECVKNIRIRIMDVAGVEESLFAISSAKLHGAMCQKLCSIVCKVLRIFPGLEAARPRSKPGIQALCSLHVALEKAKSLLQHCSDSSKLYLAITGDSVLLKFEKAKGALEESLRHVEDIVSQANGCQILDIIDELERTVFVLDQSDKQIGDEVIVLLQQERKHDSNSIGNNDLEVFHRAASRLGITSSRAALTERRALKRLIERARIEEDKHKESIVAYLLHLMRKYSKVLRSEFSNSDSLGGYASCSPPVHGYEKSIYGSPGEYPSCSPPVHGFEKSSGPTCGFESELSKFNSFTINPCGWSSADMPIAPEEFRCPISLQLMYDPVIVSSGQTYERVCIEKWFADGHSTCPKTQQHLSHLCLTPNYCVKGLIASWCDRNEIPIPSGPPESLNLNYGRLTSLESETADSENFETCKLNEVKAFSLEESKIREKPVGNEISGLDGSCQETEESEEDVYHRYSTLLAVLRGAKDIRRQCEVVEHIRFLLEHDEEARIYISANEFTEMLVQFLRLAIHKGDEKAQEAGAMALVNLAMNNNRNKEMILSAGVFPLLEEMIHNSSAYKSATALFLNLSSLEKAKLVIGSGRAISFFVHLLQVDSERQCKLNALHTLYNLSTHPANISYLLSADIVSGLDSLLAGPHDHAWAEKSIAILINLAASKVGKTEIISAPGLISVLASVLESGELLEQELAASCLLILCKGDEKCSQIVLQEGVIPALVSLSVNGTLRGTESAQKLLMLFREQRQRDTSPVAVLQPAESNAAVPVLESHALCKSKTRKMGRTWTSLWKRKNFSLYQC